MATFTILEPMSTGDVIDRAVRLYRRNFTPLVSIVAVPTLIGYVVSLMFWYGYTSLLSAASGTRTLPVSALWMLAVGALGYPVWGFVLLLAVSGLTRVVGDHVMLGERITFRGCVSAVRRRIGAITLMGLLSMAVLFIVYLVVVILVFVLILLVTLIVGVIAAARFPQWISTTALAITVIAAVALGLLVILVVLARVAFLPQSVMIEGESAGSALGRAMRLGKGNWYRVGAIILFTYFVSFSLQSALMLPVVVGLYFSGMLNAEFFVSPTWSVLYTSFRDVSNLLSFPISVVSFTLLYFDSRVRKEAYDVDLLAREIDPGFYWQGPAQPAVLGYQMPVHFSSGRSYVQTSPLGLAGYRPIQEPKPPASVDESDKPRTDAEDLREKSDRAAESFHLKESATCGSCGAPLMPNARFCMVCGTEV